jgi:hypothetical protein
VTIAELAIEVVREAALTKRQSATAWNIFLELMQAALGRGERITLHAPAKRRSLWLARSQHSGAVHGRERRSARCLTHGHKSHSELLIPSS